MKLPEYLYHGTYSTLVEHILASGLIRVPRDWRIWPGHAEIECIYLTSDPHNALHWARMGLDRLDHMDYHRSRLNILPVVLQINKVGLDMSLLLPDANMNNQQDFCYAGDVEPMWIEVV